MAVAQNLSINVMVSVKRPSAGDIANRTFNQRRTINTCGQYLGSGVWGVTDTLGYTYSVKYAGVPNTWDEVDTGAE